VDADGAVIARGQQGFDDRERAEASVSQFKEYGPDASMLAVEGAVRWDGHRAQPGCVGR